MRLALGVLLPAAAAFAPAWPPTWSLPLSTIVQPCNYLGYVEPLDFFAQFAVVDFDWSNAKALWVVPPMRDEELLVEQCARLKALNPDLRCFVYRNLVKALPWYTSVREKINDPAYSGWFLHVKPGGSLPNGTFYVDQCDRSWDPPRCSDLYKDKDQTPGFPHGDGSCPGPCDCGGVPCGEYLWDHRNASLRTWIINDFLLGPTGLGNENISGFYLDDGWSNTTQAIAPWMPKEGFCDHSPIGGPSEENFHCTQDMGLTQADTTAITDAWRTTLALVRQVLISAGSWAWAFFQTWDLPADAAACQTALTQACSAGWPGFDYGTMVQWTLNEAPYNASFARTAPLQRVDLDIAIFQTVRGSHWWLGYAWVGCSVPYDFPAQLRTYDLGLPLGRCAESAPGSGLFSRQWSKGTSSVNCNTMQGSVVVH